MKTILKVEIETKDKLMGYYEDVDKRNKHDFAEESHNGLVDAIKYRIEEVQEELPEEFEGYLEGYDKPENYGIKIKITKVQK